MKFPAVYRVVESPSPARYFRIPLAATGKEQPVAILKEEFDRTVAADRFTVDRFVRVQPGLPPRTADDIRFLKSMRDETLKRPSKELLAAIAAAEADLEAAHRILRNVEVGLDHPDLLTKAAARLMNAAGTIGCHIGE